MCEATVTFVKPPKPAKIGQDKLKKLHNCAVIPLSVYMYSYFVLLMYYIHLQVLLIHILNLFNHIFKEIIIFTGHFATIERLLIFIFVKQIEINKIK